MKFRVVVVGRPRDRELASAIAGYEERAGRYWPLEAIEVREEKGRDSAVVRVREGERLLDAAGGATLVACDLAGTRETSEGFAQRMQRWRETAHDVAFVIGGAFGLGEAVLATSSLRLQLAPWTLPHELARLVLAEQLYRAGTIVRREPYHK